MAWLRRLGVSPASNANGRLTNDKKREGTGVAQAEQGRQGYRGRNGDAHSTIDVTEKDYAVSESKKVLVVDDDPNVVRSLTFVLSKGGYDTEVATNGEEAMAKVKESKPGLMFLDVMMPKKNGYEVCQEVKGNPDLSSVYIVMLTAKGQEADKEKGLSLGADEFITKPFSPVTVLQRVKELLG